jgi:hypothetical protein
MIVLFVITNKVANFTGGAWGFGDLLKGLIHVYQLSKKYNFELYVDFQYHPISNYFKQSQHPYIQHVHEHIDNIHLLSGSEAENYIIEHSNLPIIQFLCNQMYHEPVSQDCKEFIKNIFIPNDNLQSYFQNKLNQIPYSHYDIIHYRFGDHEMFYGVPGHADEHYHNHMVNVHLTKKDNTILISDSNYFKQYVKRHTHIFLFDDTPRHVGISDDLYDTLSDFFIISNADEVTSYSVYGWASGFVKVPVDLNNVPATFHRI